LTIQSNIFLVDDLGSVEKALNSFGKGKGDFSDHLLGVRAKARGADTTYTFDRALKSDRAFTLLVAQTAVPGSGSR